MKFKVGDIVMLNPDSVKQWLRERNNWWSGYDIVPEITKFKVFSFNKDYIYLAFLDGSKLGNMRPETLVFAKDSTFNPITDRINKLYKKCKTTQHWEIQNEV